jgi:hypothetical protein
VENQAAMLQVCGLAQGIVAEVFLEEFHGNKKER